MSNRNGNIKLFALAVAAIAICGAAVMLMPAHANSDASSNNAGYAGPTGYFPADYVNQAREIEPMPVMYE